MQTNVLPPQRSPEDEWALPVVLAIAVHVLLALVLIAGWMFSPDRNTEAAVGDPALEASMTLTASEAAAARQALRASEKLPDLPQPVEQPTPVEEDTVPPPQPLPEPRPQDALSPQQQQAQERIAQPDKVDQAAVNAMAISAEKEKQEQEAKRRQEQIDLTERERQKEAEQKARLARQQEAEQQKKLAEQAQQANDAKAEAERQKKIAEIRSRREAAEKEAKLAEQKLRQVTAARAASGASSSGSAGAAQPSAGGGGTSDDLSAKYAAAIQQKVLGQWQRPDSVPLGQKCQIAITQLPGGNVIQAKVSAGCPFDEAGKRSIEAAVLNAQPLPYRGFETVFSRNINFTFTAQDR